MITVILHNAVATPEVEEDNAPPEPLVFPTPGHVGGDDTALTCLSIIRRQRDEVMAMKIVLRTTEAE